MIVVEVLGRRGEVIQQVRVAALPATIGRAWSSDVVLADATDVAITEGVSHVD